MTGARQGDGAIDFEAEGLLAGLEGEAREARRELLERLAADGVPLEELRAAVDAGRLTLLPVERAFGGAGSEYTPREIAERAGVELELLDRAAAALGIPYPDPDVRSLTEADLEAARRMKMLRDAGLPEEGILQVARTIGRAMARIAEGNRELSLRTLMQPGDTERDLALRFAAAAEHMQPLVEPVLVYALRAHMLEQIRRDVIGAANLESGEMGATSEVCVCFADLVGFTKLGEEIDPEQLGAVAGRLEEMATGMVEAPVRLVKVIGDAVMMVSGEAEPLIEVALKLVEQVEGEGEDLPSLRAGLACGQALIRAGDFYGRPVNLASRITAIAKPGSVLVDGSVQQAAPGAFDYSFAGERHLKGFDSRFGLYRVRRLGAGPSEEQAAAEDGGELKRRRPRRRGAGRRRR